MNQRGEIRDARVARARARGGAAQLAHGDRSVGEDAHVLDRMVREAPEEAYEASFMDRFVANSGWKLTPNNQG